MSIMAVPYGNSGYFTCQVCQRGVLVHKKTFRMSAPVVAIGFILLIPSVLGIVASVLFFFGVMSMSAAGIHSGRSRAIANMRAHGVPRPIIDAVADGEAGRAERLMDNWPETYEIGTQIVRMNGIPEYQRRWVHAAEGEIGGTGIVSGLGALLGGGFAIFLGIASFVGGLLGWLLVMRKRVLQCSLCHAIINAS